MVFVSAIPLSSPEPATRASLGCVLAIASMVFYREVAPFTTEFTNFIALEYECSHGHAQSCIVSAISKENLERLNDLLIEDAKDLVEDYIQEQKEESE